MSVSRRRRMAQQRAREERERQMRAWAGIGEAQLPPGLFEDDEEND